MRHFLRRSAAVTQDLLTFQNTGTAPFRTPVRLLRYADGGRYWSLLCGDPMCCPEEGRAYDPGSHPAAAVMTSAGLTAFPDREALTRTLQRPAGSADRIAQATRSAQSRLAGLLR